MLLLAIFLVLFFTVVPLFFTTFFRVEVGVGVASAASSLAGAGPVVVEKYAAPRHSAATMTAIVEA